MVLDSSALLAILLDEPERAAFARAIEQDPVRLVSAVSVFECSIVMEARGGPTALTIWISCSRESAPTFAVLAAMISTLRERHSNRMERDAIRPA